MYLYLLEMTHNFINNIIFFINLILKIIIILAVNRTFLNILVAQSIMRICKLLDVYPRTPALRTELLIRS